MLQGKHCEFHTCNQVTILPSFLTYVSGEETGTDGYVFFYCLCIQNQVYGYFVCWEKI